jgi:hypothetical protein
MKLKLTKDGHAVVRDGKPVYVHDNGREEAFDAPAAMKLAVGKHFEMSKVAGGLKIPHEIAAAAFGGEFRIERGQLVAYDKGDIPVYSHTRHGEVANFDEALSRLIERYPNKDMIQRKDGGPAPAPGQQVQTTTITRAQFDAMPQASRAKFFNEGGRIGEGAGTGAPGAAHQSSGKAITRAQFDVMPNNDRAAHFKTGGKVVD